MILPHLLNQKVLTLLNIYRMERLLPRRYFLGVDGRTRVEELIIFFAYSFGESLTLVELDVLAGLGGRFGLEFLEE
jgi:hypothetical protein